MRLMKYTWTILIQWSRAKMQSLAVSETRWNMVMNSRLYKAKTYNIKLASRRAKKGTYFGRKLSVKNKCPIDWSMISCLLNSATALHGDDDAFGVGFSVHQVVSLTIRLQWMCCTVMPSASLCNSCVNVFVLENGASRRYDASGVIFLAFSENAHLTSEAHCDQTRPARTLKFSRKVAQDVP